MNIFNLKFAILISHKNCLDGSSCIAIESNTNHHINFKYFINPNSPFGNNIFFNYFVFFVSFIFSIKFVFTDIIASDIKYLLDFYKKTSIKFEIYDHHHTQQKLVDELVSYPNLLIDFQPKSKFGATKQLVDKYNHLLRDQQINFFTKIAACDMWNKEAFPDFNYFTFGINSFKHEFNIKSILPEILWEISFDGDYYSQLFVDEGKKFYENFIENFNNILDEPVNYEEYNILLINTSKLDGPYNEMNMVSPICFYFSENKNPKINTLAIYNDDSDYVSLRSVSSDIDFDISKLAQKCQGGGHKKASGCKLQLFLYLIKQYTN